MNEASLTLSIVAIVLTILNLYVIWKHNRTSLRPYLYFTTDINRDEKRIQAFLKNKGVGPAIVKGLICSYKGKPVEFSSTKQGLRKQIEAYFEKRRKEDRGRC